MVISHASAARMPAPTTVRTVTIHLDGVATPIPCRVDETVLEAARRAGLAPPSSCEAGNCGTCMAVLVDGHVEMRVNDALTDDDLAAGYILTCQAVPHTDSVAVEYP